MAEALSGALGVEFFDERAALPGMDAGRLRVKHALIQKQGADPHRLSAVLVLFKRMRAYEFQRHVRVTKLHEPGTASNNAFPVGGDSAKQGSLLAPKIPSQFNFQAREDVAEEIQFGKFLLDAEDLGAVERSRRTSGYV